jgi:hypothetical protein
MGTWIRSLLPFVAMVTAIASPVTYVETVTASGSLGSINFSNELITFTMTGDTSNVVSGGGIYTLTVPLTVSVAGITGSATFTHPTWVIDNENYWIAGFADLTALRGVLFTYNAAFAGYTLQGSFGPISGSSETNLSYPFATTSGALAIDSLSGVSTFTAEVTETTPEPAGIFPVGVAVIALPLALHRLKVKSLVAARRIRPQP